MSFNNNVGNIKWRPIIVEKITIVTGKKWQYYYKIPWFSHKVPAEHR